MTTEAVRPSPSASGSPSAHPAARGVGLGLAAEPRLLALRVQGFKSFAERTNVEFGPGISAVVGPNGSGKSNLADALRWALGEQGKALRSRKAEDVIWAGSDKRPALGMAEVSLIVDNSDGLLPVDYQVLELGRRLFRSGENDYLLNKNRVRLRELVELLDAAHLADNAFLFIGQGMVDQALALRPEERRPLFDEVAGVRRHERRRRRAEEQLVESEANLARVEDILGELRPQVRRLAAQAEQQATRRSTADELASALLASMHARWFETSGRLATVSEDRGRAQAEVDRATEDLGAAETVVASLAEERSARAATERERTEALDVAVAARQAAELADVRMASEADALVRERDRLAAERASADAEVTAARRSLAAPVPVRDRDLDRALGDAERSLAAALEELAALRGAQQAHEQEQASIRRAAAARAAELDAGRRRVTDAERRLSETDALEATLTATRDESEHDHTDAVAALGRAQDAERAASAARADARERVAAADAARLMTTERLTAATASLAAVRGQIEILDARLAEEEAHGIARAARRVGGRRVDEDLVIDPPFRAAVEAALSEAGRAYLVGADTVAGLSGERGSLVIAERAAAAAPSADARERRFLDAVVAAGGGSLDAAIRRDGGGAARRWLSRAVWLPDLRACLELQGQLPPGWLAVPRDGTALVTDLTVTLGAADSILERRTTAARLRAQISALEAEVANLQAAASDAASAAEAAAAGAEAARRLELEASTAHRAAEVAERETARQLEAAMRELAWHQAQRERLVADVGRARDALAGLTQAEEGSPDTSMDAPAGDNAAIAAWEARAAGLRASRDRLAEQVAAVDANVRDADHRRARAEAALTNAEERLASRERDLASVAGRAAELEGERERSRDEIVTLRARESAARDALATLRAADVAGLERIERAEAVAATARERLRTADARLRAADHAELEVRLNLDTLRESMLVELAGLGELAYEILGSSGRGGAADGDQADDDSADDSADDDASRLEGLLGPIAASWAVNPPTDPPPSAVRLGQLRRRFHDLGAINASAVDEYAAQKARLDALEGQATDLRAAIERTRELIAELDGMIGDRFQTTFRALEAAFAARFEQLFGGGFARLSLTDPDDIGASGIDIVARPPGKKPQALAMLSGGERALTAVALLFAMLEVRPVPFCVLDEVDAALDEANIGRFADALRSLADRTQFIVITHNRGTIEAADALYGVTSGDDSVSRVISLRLDEAQALASRGGSAA